MDFGPGNTYAAIPSVPDGRERPVIRFDCLDEQAAKERVRLLAGEHDGELWQLIAPFDSLRELKP
jgi:hypothetical protein